MTPRLWYWLALRVIARHLFCLWVQRDHSDSGRLMLAWLVWAWPETLIQKVS
jgi:hypothetical protein